MIRFLTVLLIALFPYQAFAANESKDETKTEATEEASAEQSPAENPGLFAPDFCDFEITFPEKPALVEKCIPGGDCYELRSYTMVYSIESSIDVSANCTPSTPENFKRYTQPVMKTALAGMVDEHRLKEYDINVAEEKDYRSAALTGAGIQGASEKLFTGQIWVGPNSVFTVQAQLIGAADKAADDAFSSILKSIKHKGGKQLPKKAKAPSATAPKNQ